MSALGWLLNLTVLRPSTVTVPVRPKAASGFDFPRRPAETSAVLPALWSAALDARAEPQPAARPFAPLPVERVPAAAWPRLEPIVGSTLPQPAAVAEAARPWGAPPPAPAVPSTPALVPAGGLEADRPWPDVSGSFGLVLPEPTLLQGLPALVPQPGDEPLPEAPPEPAPAAPPETPELEPASEPGPEPDPEPELPPAAKQPKQAKPPLHKRELHLPRPWPARRPGHRPQGIVGLRVGSTQLAAAHVRTNGSVEVVQLARTPLAPGVVVGGEVREPDALAEALKDFFDEHKLPRRSVRLGVASGRIGVRVLELPPIADARQLENAIRFRAHEVIPIPIAEAVLDHVVIGSRTAEDGSPILRILVAFAHRELVSRQVDACRKAGLRPIGVDLDGFALLRALAVADSVAGAPLDRAVVAVAIGHERTVFAVSDGRVCDFTRVLEWGGSAVDIALAQALDISTARAGEIKRELTLTGDGPVAGLAPAQVEAARAAVRLELGALARELVSSLRFYQTRPESLDIGEILVTGGASQLPGALAELEEAIGAPVRAGDPLGRVKLGKRAKRPADAASYAIAVGLGMER